MVGADGAHSRNLLSGVSGSAQRPTAPAGPRVAFAQRLTSKVAYDPEEDDDDHRDSVIDPPVVDKTLTRLFNFVYERFVDARPLSDPSTPPRCEFKDYFTIADPPTSARQRLRVYPRLTEILDSSSEKTSLLARESKPLRKVVPLRRRAFQIRIFARLDLLILTFYVSRTLRTF